MKARLLVPCVLLLGLLSQGCALFVAVPPLEPLPESRVVVRMDYAPQTERWDCGPACLTSVMGHYGSTLTLDDVKGQLKQTDDGGTLVLEMIVGARLNGFHVQLSNGSLNELRRSLFDRKPLILFLHPSPDFVRVIGRRGHYVVAVGYDDDERHVILHSGDKAYDIMSYRQLQLQWGRASFIALLVEK